MKPRSRPSLCTSSNIQELFNEFANYCKYTLRRSPDTIRGYTGTFSTFIKLCPITYVGELCEEKITLFFTNLQTRERKVGRGILKKGVKDSTIDTYASKLHTFFEWLVDKGHLDENPLRHIKRVHPVYDDSKALRKEEIDKIRTAIETHSKSLWQLKRDKVMLSLLIFCGIRRGELLGLQITDVDMQKRILTVSKTISKSKHSRLIPINSRLFLHLQDYLEERKRQKIYSTQLLVVALNQDHGLSKDGLKHWVNRLREVSKVRFHIHQFRHTFAINLGRSAINAIVLQRLLGHTDLRMTQKYVRSLTPEDLRPAIDRLSFEDMA